MRDIGDPQLPFTEMIGDDFNYFQGHFSGGGHTIYIEIESDNLNVGLFSQVGAYGRIENLIIDGYVIGGTNSQNVGGFAGQALQYSDFMLCTNLSDVMGLSDISSVGGIVGTVNMGIIADATNKGAIIGGKYVAGIIGSSVDIAIKYCYNSGSIGINGSIELSSYLAGIVAYCSGFIDIHDGVNIGRIGSISSGIPGYAGGIVGYVENNGNMAFIYICSNSGVVDSAEMAVGGIVGYIPKDAIVQSCINTNWISIFAPISGAIVGHNDGGLVDACFFDDQMSIVAGIGLDNGVSQVLGLSTVNMIGNNLSLLLNIYGGWTF